MSIIRRVFRRGTVCAALLVLSPAGSSAAELIVAPPLARSIQVHPDLRIDVEAMLRTSPTFRWLYGRVASARVIVGVRTDPALVSRTFRARSTIRRYDSGLIVVAVVVGPGSGQAGWIAHEFEHIVEQLDGLNLRALADHHAPGVWYSADQMIETSRAAQAGRAVVEEMKEQRRRSDKLVE